MSKLKHLEIGNPILYSRGYFSGFYNQDLYIKRVVSDNSNDSKYYLSVFTNINGELIQQGFLYFYLNNETKTSNFIGLYVEPEYRNLNIGSFLVASWIDLCLNNGYDFLGANKKQRKPFLLYLLKTYGFEILDKSLYKTRKDIISIHRSADFLDKRKLLLFKSQNHEKIFMSTNIYKNDNYEIIHESDGTTHLDDIILPLQNMKKSQIKYELSDLNLAEEKTQKVILRHKR